MPGFVEGKVVVVTGAGGGIGREIALALGSAGAKVVVNDIGASLTGDGRDSGAASKVVNEITERGGIAVANTDSIAEMVSANRIITTAVEHFGRIDAVINNAGILRDRAPRCRPSSCRAVPSPRPSLPAAPHRAGWRRVGPCRPS